MKISRRDGSDVRQILTGMIVNKTVLGNIATRWQKDEGGLFRDRWANLIAGWCLKYYNHYNDAPGAAIEHQFATWAAKPNTDKEAADLTEKFLGQLSGEYDTKARECNHQYILDISARHFNTVRLARLQEAITAEMDTGNVDGAMRLVDTHSHIEIGVGAGVDVFSDTTALRAAFEDNAEPLVKYRGAMGKFYGSELQRGAFIAYMAPVKTGKTWGLIDLGFESALQRRKVAFFAVGDMSQNQMMRRIAARICRRPLKPKTIQIPTLFKREEDEFILEYKEKEFTDTLSWQDVQKAAAKLLERQIKSDTSMFRLSCHPNSSISVAGINNVLTGWERFDGWVPDVICIDYADILAPMDNSAGESRDKVNATWKALRRMSQERNILVATATQSDAAGFDATVLTRRNFSEDNRKLAHVTGMVGLTRTEADKEKGVFRWNWIVLREDEFFETKCVYSAGCLGVAAPCILSTY